MKNLTRLLNFAVLVLALTASGWAQVTLRSTTLSAAVAVGDQQINVASTSGVTAGMIVYVSGDREAMRVTSVVSSTVLTVKRGASSTPIFAHPSGATVYIDLPQYFKSGNLGDLYGSCNTTDWIATPVINITTGNTFTCTSSLWTITNGPAASATGITSLTPNVAGAVDIGTLDTAFRTAYLTSSINFEGSTADAYETTVTAVDPTADQTISIPNNAVNASFLTSTLTTNKVDGANSVWGVSNGLTFEGATADAYETTITPTDPTADRTITLPDASITVPGTVHNDCGVANACSAALKSSITKIVTGITAALDGASPAVATVTGMPAFTSTTSYHCTAGLSGATAAIAAMNIAVSNVSATSVTFTAANGSNAPVEYICIGW